MAKFNILSLSMTLTLELRRLMVHATHSLMMVNICGKFIKIITCTINVKITVRTSLEARTHANTQAHTYTRPLSLTR
jgi:hypothetical protein